MSLSVSGKPGITITNVLYLVFCIKKFKTDIPSLSSNYDYQLINLVYQIEF